MKNLYFFKNCQLQQIFSAQMVSCMFVENFQFINLTEIKLTFLHTNALLHPLSLSVCLSVFVFPFPLSFSQITQAGRNGSFMNRLKRVFEKKKKKSNKSKMKQRNTNCRPESLKKIFFFSSGFLYKEMAYPKTWYKIFFCFLFFEFLFIYLFIYLLWTIKKSRLQIAFCNLSLKNHMMPFNSIISKQYLIDESDETCRDKAWTPIDRLTII